MKLLGASVGTRDARLEPVIPEDGTNGNDGWTPILGGEADGTRSLLKVVDWTGGEGTKPQKGMYIGPAGYVATKADGFNFNIAKRVIILSAQTNSSGVASFTFGASPALSVPPAVRALPATTALLSGPTKSTVSAVTATGCTVTVQQQAVLTGIVSALAGATANIIVIEA